MKKCCWCCDLKNGCMTIAMVELVFGFISFMRLITAPDPDLLDRVVHAVTTILILVASGVLILGAQKKNRNYLLFWMVVKIIEIIIIGIYIVFILVLLSEIPRDDRPVFICAEIILLIALAVCIYFLMVVKAYRQEMKSSNNNVIA